MKNEKKRVSISVLALIPVFFVGNSYNIIKY